MSVLGNCKQGYHEDCVATIVSFTATLGQVRQRCSCSCHKSGRMDVEHRPTSRESRVMTRGRSWNQHWAYAAFGVPKSQGGYTKEYVDESIKQEPLSKEELWKRMMNGL